MDQLSQNLATTLTRKTVAASGLAQTVSLLPTISQEEFSAIAERVASNDPSVAVASLIQDWRITHIYPIESNRAILGADLRTSAARVEAINQVIERGTGLIQGPIRLLMGTDGFVVRQPIAGPTMLDQSTAAAQAPDICDANLVKKGFRLKHQRDEA